MFNYPAYTVNMQTAIVLRRLRINSGMTSAAIAKAAGLSPQQILKYETNKNRITIGIFCSFCKAMGLMPHEVMRIIDTEIEKNDK